ncbi:hypothetical protein ANCCAN_28915 [Ancylostoma caninum]|uniref:Transmembrane protein n=1 Tax=Ancylostoma caninum TaxID=29170 RepID=A0A368EZX9_ANCCA|nr:hypothetical protein ANCCAN_28915 [Ancylostoma caninum]
MLKFGGNGQFLYCFGFVEDDCGHLEESGVGEAAKFRSVCGNFCDVSRFSSFVVVLIISQYCIASGFFVVLRWWVFYDLITVSFVCGTSCGVPLVPICFRYHLPAATVDVEQRR